MQWAQLVARWLHVIAGAAWIGTSFYFNWLNYSLRAPAPERPGVAGELWSVHGGGFYRAEKYAVAPERLPERLHWSKWEAYFTWVTGVALLVFVYYLGSGATLRDATVSSIGQSAAVALGLATLGLGWLVYDGLCRSPLRRRPAVLAVVLLVFVAIVSWALSQLLSGRGMAIHVGAMVGTWMAANVFFVIIPSQRAMVAAMASGAEPDPEKGRQGALRSLHNNYLTLPVLYSMVSIHYPVTYATPRAWLLLPAVGVIGVAARHFYNLRHQGRPRPWLLPAAAAGVAALALATAPWGMEREAVGEEEAAERESFAVVRTIVEERCVACHARSPTHGGFTVPPLGVVLETPGQIRAHAATIGDVVARGTMPFGNVTGMTPEEREVVVRWVREGARTD